MTSKARGIEARLEKVLPPRVRTRAKQAQETLKLRAYSFFKIPLLFFVSPTVMELTSERCAVKIPLNRRTRNHLGSMYFGVMSTGADCAGALIAWRLNEEKGNPLSLVFKEFKAEFLKRAEGDVFFTCEQGTEIEKFVDQCIQSGERSNFPLRIVATVPSKLGKEPVARFELLLSMKLRSKA